MQVPLHAQACCVGRAKGTDLSAARSGMIGDSEMLLAMPISRSLNRLTSPRSSVAILRKNAWLTSRVTSSLFDVGAFSRPSAYRTSIEICGRPGLVAH